MVNVLNSGSRGLIPGRVYCLLLFVVSLFVSRLLSVVCRLSFVVCCLLVTGGGGFGQQQSGFGGRGGQ